jgi:carboxyl-terminal processing protease
MDRLMQTLRLLLLVAPWLLLAQGLPPASAQPLRVADEAVQHSPTLHTVLEQGQKLELERRWSDALSHYEHALRENPENSGLQQRLDAVRVRLDITRRYADGSFVSGLRKLEPAQVSSLLAEVLLKIQTHFVNQVDWRLLYWRGADTLLAALEDPAFVAANAPGLQPQDVRNFRALLHEQSRSLRLQDRRDTYQAILYVARLARQQLGISESAASLEFAAGCVTALDEYSAFLTGTQLDELYSQIEGNFVGLGIELKAEPRGLAIVNVIAGGPAHESGVQVGDYIVAIDGRPTTDVANDRAADLLKGPEGSSVEITLLTDDGQRQTSVTIIRRRVEVPSVDQVKMLDGDVGYLRLVSFQKSTSRDVDSALWQLHRQGMRVLVIDLRGNPGGLLSASVEVADKFLSQGAIVSTRGRSESEDYDYRAHAVGTWRTPLILLIDGDSASASEIFAGAIRDQRRGVLVGQRSYGKGSVQGIFPLQSAGAGVRLTTAKFYSPSGQPISKQGIAPDVVVQTVARPADNGQRVAENEDPVLNAGLQMAREQLSRR